MKGRYLLMAKYTEFAKLHPSIQKKELRSHRKPPIPPSRKSDSKADVLRKRRRLEKQKLRKEDYNE